jgi:hypothetical protein
MRKLIVAGLPVLALLASPAAGQNRSENPDTRVNGRDISAEDVVTTPASDLNIKRDEIPALLRAAEERPYVLQGLNTCSQITGAIGELDAILGEDVDLPQDGNRKMRPGRVAQSVVGSLIPFRGLIREISGANAHDRALQQAVLAGVARRSFLKGIGQGKGCRYPARAATIEVYNARMAALNAGRDAPKSDRDAKASASSTSSVQFVSTPVVQGAKR